MKKYYTLIFILIMVVLSGCSSEKQGITEKTELTISAAASLTEALLELQDTFEKEHPEIQISYNFGGSGSLRKQIEQGAPIDLFLSASSIDYEKLVDRQRVVEGKEILTNNLVLISGNGGEDSSFDSFLAGEGIIAIGTPEAVPAGTYAQETLTKLGAWDLLEEQDRLAPTKDVSQVLSLVREGAVDVGIVYSSDVKNEDDVTILHEFDKNLHSPIKYFAAIIDNGEESETILKAKETYYQFISSESAKKVFEQYGFQIIVLDQPLVE
ncbi:molybdate ABC transporter substrate-binding protein [Oceanobacillus sp. Castelsardo]|uniref:molybdate ABC transporter substrate-binding protein n=1 Tax=Oceanobacillus sp. Castelsardo TaxID=1851204 RepID=UPI0008380F99|nr:molybdate ABC transporter substrate-binding protein [Oceanobacillus sp. Castelsardo]